MSSVKQEHGAFIDLTSDSDDNGSDEDFRIAQNKNTLNITKSNNNHKLKCKSNDNNNNTNNNNNQSKSKAKHKAKKDAPKILLIDSESIRKLVGCRIIKISTSHINTLYKLKIKRLTKNNVNPQSPQPLQKSVNLMMSQKYAHNAGWTSKDGFREILQNWIDGCHMVQNRLKTNNSKFKIQPTINGKNYLSFYYFMFNNNEFNIKDVENNELIGAIISKQEKGKMILKFVNYGVALDASKLIIGETSKQNDKTTIGRYGEGLKMGANILLHAGHGFTILTNTKNWQFVFKKSQNFLGANQKQLHVSPHQKDTQSPAQIIVTITNVERRCLDIGNEILNTKIKQIYFCNDIETTNYFTLYHPRNGEHIKIKTCTDNLDGNILIGDKYKKKIYSNGVYVGDNDYCYYGYNINQNALPLNRDRTLTYKALAKLRYDIPRYWVYAIQNDRNLAKKFIALTGTGQTICQPMEISYIQPLLNNDIATALFDEFKKNLDENEQTTYFIVSILITTSEAWIVEKELLAKPYKINQSLYEIFCKSSKFDTIQDALKKQLNILKDSPKSELTNVEKKFVKEFVKDIKSLFPKLKEYTFYFKSTKMNIECKIIEKNIIFKHSYLNELNTAQSNEKKLYIKLIRSMKSELIRMDIVSPDQFDEEMFAGYYTQIQKFKKIEMMQIDNHIEINNSNNAIHNNQIDQITNIQTQDTNNNNNNDNYDDGCNMYNDDNENNEIVKSTNKDDKSISIASINTRKRKTMDQDANENENENIEIKPEPKRRRLNEYNNNQNSQQDKIVQLQNRIKSLQTETNQLKHELNVKITKNKELNAIIKTKNNEIDKLKGELKIFEQIRMLMPSK